MVRNFFCIELGRNERSAPMWVLVIVVGQRHPALSLCASVPLHKLIFSQGMLTGHLTGVFATAIPLL